MSPARRRAAVSHLVSKLGVSQRRACRLVGQPRSTQRYVVVPGDFEQRLVKAMRALDDRHPRYGYRRVHSLLVAEGWGVNVKRVERLWAAESLQVPPRRVTMTGARAVRTPRWTAGPTGANLEPRQEASRRQDCRTANCDVCTV